jgi:hypothetical protein
MADVAPALTPAVAVAPEPTVDAEITTEPVIAVALPAVAWVAAFPLILGFRTIDIGS